MDHGLLVFAVGVLLVLAVLVAVVYDLRHEGRYRPGDLNAEALRRAREANAHHQSTVPPAGAPNFL